MSSAQNISASMPCDVKIHNWCSFSDEIKVGIALAFAAFIICTICMACRGAQEDWGDWDGSKKREMMRSRDMLDEDYDY